MKDSEASMRIWDTLIARKGTLRSTRKDFMGTFKARGIVLKEIEVGESDKIIVLLLKDMGKISVSAKGARKHRSKFLAGTEIFTYSDYIIYDGKKFYSLAQVDIIESFYNLRGDYTKLCYGNYLLELCERVILENMPCDDILLLLLKSLGVLSKNLIEPGLIKIIFDFKFLQMNGYSPEMTCCSVCGREDMENAYFGANGLVCRQCRQRRELNEGYGTINISEAARYTINYILNSERSDLFKFTVTTQLLKELSRADDIFMNANIDVRLKSREFL